MICQIIVLVLLYCLFSGKYRKYITINIPIPGINSPIMLMGGQDNKITSPLTSVQENTIYTPLLY